MINNLYSNVKFNDYVPTFETYEEKLLSIKNTYTTGYKLAEIYHDGISDAIYSPISNDSSNIPSYNDISTKLCAESSSRISNDDYLCSQLSSLSDIQPISNSLSIEYVDRTQYYNLSAGNITSNNTSRKIYILSNMFSYMNNQNIINLGSAILSLDAVPKFQVDALSNIIDTLSDLYDQLSTAYSEISSTSSTTEPDNNYFCIEALDDEVHVSLDNIKNELLELSSNNNKLYKNSNNSEWFKLDSEQYYIILSAGNKLKIRNITSNSSSNIKINITNGKANIYGKLANSLNLPSLVSNNTTLSGLFSGSKIYSASELDLDDIYIVSDGYFANMFKKCTYLVYAPLKLPITSKEKCYTSMFQGCTSLISTPELPATNLVLNNYCYSSMFEDCTSLTSAPELPATILADYCYYRMFFGCTKLKFGPSKLPAKKLKSHCYDAMFQECESLIATPTFELSNVAEYCCANMFYYCSALTTANINLYAQTLNKWCYYQMFSKTALTTAQYLYATTLATSCYSSMFAYTKVKVIHYAEKAKDQIIKMGIDETCGLNRNEVTIYYDL